MKFNEIDRFIESEESTLANITVILHNRLGCTKEVTKDIIYQKLIEIKAFDILEARDFNNQE